MNNSINLALNLIIIFVNLMTCTLISINLYLAIKKHKVFMKNMLEQRQRLEQLERLVSSGGLEN